MKASSIPAIRRTYTGAVNHIQLAAAEAAHHFRPNEPGDRTAVVTGRLLYVVGAMSTDFPEIAEALRGLCRIPGIDVESIPLLDRASGGAR